MLEKEGQEYEFGENDRLKNSMKLAAVHYREGEPYFVQSLILDHTTEELTEEEFH